MKPIQTPYTNKVFVLPGGTEENNLPIEATEDEEGFAVLISTWEPTDEEYARLREGGHIRLTIFGVQHPPVAVSVEEEDPQLTLTQGICTRCSKPWQDHYDPKLLKYKLGPFGTFGLVSDHTPHVSGVHA